MESWMTFAFPTSKLKSVQDFLIKLDMKPCMHLVEISIFFTKLYHRQTYRNYEQPSQTSQNSYFQSYFSVFKIGQIFPKKNSWHEKMHLVEINIFTKSCHHQTYQNYEQS